MRMSAWRALRVGLPLWLAAASAGAQTDWMQFNFDAGHRGVNPREGILDAGNVGSLQALYNVLLPGVVDGAPAFLSRVTTAGGVKDLLFVTTRDGRAVALDAATGAQVWSRKPGSGPNYTTSSPAIDPNRQFVYSYGLDGRVHKLQVGDGVEVTGGGWPQLATLKPDVEKGSAALAIAAAGGGAAYLYVANGGYPGDAGDYQGHVTAINLATGGQHVFNADCSDQTVHFVEGGSPDCPQVQTAVWARPGVVYDADLDRILLATGNGTFDANTGGRDWGDSVLALHPDGTGAGGLGGRPLDSYTPAEFQALQDQDADLGSTAPAILPAPARSAVAHLAAQSGKDGMIRLLDLDDLSGRGGPGHVGGELQKIAVPQGGEVLTALAVWVNPADGPSGSPWVFVANGSGISGLQLTVNGAGAPALVPRWSDGIGGTSPILANGVLYYDTPAGIRALDPLGGRQLFLDGAVAGVHWQSPIVVNGRLYLTDQIGHLVAYGLATPPPCVADATTLCLNGRRFQVRVTWKTAAGATGDGQAAPLTPDTGYFWFFNSQNVELLIKVLNGCAADNAYWVFAGGLTDVRTVTTVTDTRTGQAKTYRNLQGHPFQPVQDTAAFPSCP
jgi:outer membrane protein assembly factor BamB